MALNLFDQAMLTYGGKNWTFCLNDEPQPSRKQAAEIENPISFSDFLLHACRPPGGVKTVSVLFDYHRSVPEFGLVDKVYKAIKDDSLETLPAQMKMGGPLPPGCKLGCVIHNNEDGTYTVLKIMHFAGPLNTKEAVKLCSGEPFLPVFRQGPWAVKKALLSLVGRLPGYHVSQAQNISHQSQAPIQRQRSQTWSVPNEELRKGVAFINEECPPCDAANEQYLWILENIKEDSGSCIACWPEAKVTKMAQNKSKGSSGAMPKTKFPLNTYSLKPVLSDFLLPLLYPLLMNFAQLMFGWPKVGKTPTFIIMGLAMGRYHIARLGLDKIPSWRRAKSLDNFRQRLQQVWEAIFLDDPNRTKVTIDDLKSYVTVEEDQTCSGRYNDVQLCQNGTRGLASNDIAAGDEPAADDRTQISPDEFFKLISKAFAGDNRADVLAVLKRSLTYINGKHAFYLRLPSEREDAIVHRITDMDLHKDFLSEKDKPFYNMYKNGTCVYPPDFYENVEREQEMIAEGVRKMMQEESIDDYIIKCNQQIASKLQSMQAIWLPAPSAAEAPTAFVRVLPPSQDADDRSHEIPLQSDGTYMVPLVPVRTGAQQRNKFGSKFSGQPGVRRLRQKTSPTEARSSSSGAWEMAPVVAECDEDTEIDEEASAQMHGGVPSMDEP